MKRNRRWLLLLVPLALIFAWAYQAASWRPKLVGVNPTILANSNGLKQIGLGGAFGPLLLTSPDGKWLASASHDTSAHYLTLWDLNSRRQLWQQKDSTLYPLAFSPDSQTLAVAAEEGTFGPPRFAI